MLYVEQRAAYTHYVCSLDPPFLTRKTCSSAIESNASCRRASRCNATTLLACAHTRHASNTRSVTRPNNPPRPRSTSSRRSIIIKPTNQPTNRALAVTRHRPRTPRTTHDPTRRRCRAARASALVASPSPACVVTLRRRRAVTTRARTAAPSPSTATCAPPSHLRDTSPTPLRTAAARRRARARRRRRSAQSSSLVVAATVIPRPSSADAPLPHSSSATRRARCPV